MAVKRIVANIGVAQVDAAKPFYGDVLGMKVVMDFGWILTFASDGSTSPQLSVATEGGSGTSVPDLSVEVDDIDDVYQRVLAAGFTVEYGPVIEPWGVRRFYVRDPFGRLLNVLTHE